MMYEKCVFSDSFACDSERINSWLADYDAQLGSEMNLRFSDHVRHVMNTATSSPDMLWQPSVTDEDTNKVESSPLLLSSVQFPLKSENETDEDESKVDLLPRSLSDVQFLVRSENETLNDAFPHQHYDFPAQHPCGQFSFPPPPSDRKRTGPRRKFEPLLSIRVYFNAWRDADDFLVFFQHVQFVMYLWSMLWLLCQLFHHHLLYLRICHMFLMNICY